MELITITQDLAAVCARLSRHPFVTIDTEFLRETRTIQEPTPAETPDSDLGRWQNEGGAALPEPEDAETDDDARD